MTDLLALPGLRKLELDEDEPPYNNAACGVCGNVQSSDSLVDPLFVTAYRHGSDREDYFAVVCARCGDKLIQGWKLSL